MRFDASAPVFRDPWFRALLILLTLIAALYLGHMIWQLVGQVADLIVLFAVAWLISFVLEPSVLALSRLPWLSRTAAVLLVYFGLLVALSIGAILLLPALASQSALAAQQLPALGERIGASASGISALLAERGVAVGNYTEQLLRPIEAIGPLLVANALVLATGAASVVVQVLLVIILSVYLMLDSERIGNYLHLAVPARYRHDFIFFVDSVYRAFGGFLRGQIIQSLVYGVGVALIMAVWDLPYTVLASVVAGIAIFIPFLGPVLGFLPPALAVLATGDPGRMAWVLLLTLALNVLVVNVIAPKVMSQQIGLHPVLVLAAVLIGARVAGPWGALFAVPVAAVIVTMVSFYQLTHAQRREQVLGRVEDEQPENVVPTPLPPEPVEIK